MKFAREHHTKKVLVLPSSIHEVIIKAYRDDDIEICSKMVREVNRVVVAEEEQLETYGQEDRRGRGKRKRKRENVHDESILFYRWTDRTNQGGKINEKTFLCGAECIMEYAGRFI